MTDHWQKNKGLGHLPLRSQYLKEENQVYSRDQQTKRMVDFLITNTIPNSQVSRGSFIGERGLDSRNGG